VAERELYGRWLASSVVYEYEGVGSVRGRREVRLATLDGEVRQVGDPIPLCGVVLVDPLSFERSRAPR
jgi:hypothetical protein